MSRKFLQKIFGRRTDTPIPAPTTPDPETGQQGITAAAEGSETKSITAAAEAQAEVQGGHNDPEQTTQPCTGWIEIRSRYMHFAQIAVSGQITLSKLEND